MKQIKLIVFSIILNVIISIWRELSGSLINEVQIIDEYTLNNRNGITPFRDEFSIYF
jgi:hypothetical protein